jgi:hypothetical protein
LVPFVLEVEQAFPKRDYSTGFSWWLAGGHHLCGETLDVEGHSVLVAVKQPFSLGFSILR